MIVFGVMFFFSLICGWIMAKVEYEQEKNEMAWKLLALKAVEELYKQKKKREKTDDQWTVRTKTVSVLRSGGGNDRCKRVNIRQKKNHLSRRMQKRN